MRPFLLVLLLQTFQLSAQVSPEWLYLRPSNTGVGAEEHNFVSDDRFGNIWTGGRSAIQGEGAVIRFNPEDTIFTAWSNFEGFLPGQFVLDAEIDQNDNLWVATSDGLCKYDGVTWTVYNTSNTPLPSDYFRSITIDPSGVVWVTFQEITFTIGGIASFNGNNWTYYTPANSNLPTYQVGNILIDSQNNKWIHAQTSVIKFDGLNFIEYNYQNSGLWGPQVYDIALDSLDRLYALTDMNGWYAQVNIFDGTSWSYMNYTTQPALGNYMYHRIFIREEKIILAESGGSNTVTMFDGLNWSTFFGGDMINKVFIDRNSNFWVASISTLSRLTPTGWLDYERYSTALAEHHNYDIFVDNQDRLWAANGNGGVQVFDCPRWESYGPLNQGLFPSPQTLSSVGATTCQDSQGNIWFAYNSTNGTVVKIPGGIYSNYASWEVFDLSNSPVSWVESSIADGFGNVFFYSDYGTHMYNNNTSTWTTWDVVNSPLQYYSYGFGVDDTGKVYFGGFQQIAVYHNGVWDSIPLTGTTISVVNGIDFDSQGNMWLATDEGVWRKAGSTWTQWTKANSQVVADHVTSIIVAGNDSVYISGFDASGFLVGGISVYNGSNWVKYRVNNSDLPGEQIYDIAIDSESNLYINNFGQGVSVFRIGGVSGFGCIDRSLQGGGTSGTAVVQDGKSEGLSIWPNPADDQITVVMETQYADQIIFEILDITGRTVLPAWHFNGNGAVREIKADISKLKPGLYVCRAIAGGKIQSRRMVVR